MSYSEFTLETVERECGVTMQEAVLFLVVPAVPIPSWLSEALSRGTRLALISGKARSEFIVVPILLAARELSNDAPDRGDVIRGVDQEPGFILLPSSVSFTALPEGANAARPIAFFQRFP